MGEKDATAFTITGRHIEITPYLKNHAENKVSRLFRYSFQSMTVDLVLTIEKNRHIAEVIVHAGGDRFLAKGQTHEMYHSIDQAIDKVEQQLRKRKDKKARFKSGTEPRTVRTPAPTETAVFRRDSRLVPTLSAEDAAARLEREKSKLLVFIDDSDEKLKLMKRRGKQITLTELITD